VTVVGQKTFVVAIHSQDTEETQIDWRKGSNISLEHTVIDLPDDVRSRCISLVERLGLRFGAIDLIRDRSGDFWFLEINPNGQWAWIERRTGLPITAAIVDELEAISKS
jgi:glutathione synthase/RimK-type ligase-like ATP-grasp enzyme